MKNFLFSAMAIAAVLVMPGAAFADDAGDRTDAIRLCRAEIASQAGVDLNQVRLDQVRVRRSTVRVDLDLWRGGDLQNIRCDVNRDGDALQIAQITPALQTVALTQ